MKIKTLYNNNKIIIDGSELILTDRNNNIIKKKSTKSKNIEQISFIADKLLTYGDIIEYGEYYNSKIQWEFIKENENGSLMLLSKNILTYQAFCKNKYGNWGNSDLRYWLNYDFIKKTKLEYLVEDEHYLLNDRNEKLIVCLDKVRLLSKQEANKYLNKDDLIQDMSWWLLTSNFINPSIISYVNKDGDISCNAGYFGSLGIRPVINIDKKCVKTVNNIKNSKFPILI